MIHCAPVAVRSRSFSSCGIAMATIVWSMNIIATAKIIAASTRFLFAGPGMRGSLAPSAAR